MSATVVAFATDARAVNQTGAFELDGNATSANAAPPKGPAADWDRVCFAQAKKEGLTDAQATARCTAAQGATGATAFAWKDATQEELIFTGGGSKDAKDPENDWLWKPASTVPDKDTLRHAFAVRYSLAPSATTCPAAAGETTCEVIFFGADRFANDGDAQMGFWFLQNRVTRTNTASQGGFTFSGHHLDGDLLLVSDFSNGGARSTIKGYFWDTTCASADASETNLLIGQCADTNLRLTARSTTANCATTAATASFCGIVNPTNGTFAPWPFLDKKGKTTYLQGEFFEAGVNLSALGIGSECFSTVIAETRSSDSVSATLKDVVDMPFGNCGASIQISPDATNEVGQPHTFTVHVEQSKNGVATPVAGVKPTVTLTASDGAVVSGAVDSCASTGTGADGNCTVTFTSNSTGVVTGHAAATVVINGTSFSVATDGQAPNSADAVKRFVDAAIAITPATATNPLNTEHTLTITVTSAGGNLTAGTATASITSGPGSFVGSNSCNYTGGATSSSCTVKITSATPGTTTISASSSISVGGVAMTRSTDGTTTVSGLVNSGPAQKNWADATIAITPASATNAVGTNHALTITVSSAGANLGNGTATASITSGPGSFVGSHICSYTGGGTTASCTVTITSTATGTTVVSATSNIPLEGDGSVERTTSGTAGNSGPAQKEWVDAAIVITPAMETNPVKTEHTLTITVSSAGGNLTAGTATASITGGPGSFVGGIDACNYAGGAPTASCTVTITSAVTGTTVISATSDISVGGVTMTRTTDGTTTVSGLVNSGPAQKKWADATIAITPATATNEVGTDHVLTITVSSVGANLGNGTATASITSGPGSFVGGINTCNYTGGGTTASCTVRITSTAIGTTVVSATSTIPLQGVGSVEQTTTGTAGNSGSAEKKWVDAAIAITPATATNPVGTEHTLTITVTSAGGNLSAGTGTATASITAGPGSFVGSNSCTYTGGGTSASCTVKITSAVTGTTVISATSDISVAGVTMTRTTDGTSTVSGLVNSGPAQKSWGDVVIAITPAAATNAVDTDHVLTITVSSAGANLGNGTATASITSGPGSFVGSNICSYTGGGTTASCTVTITSTATGTTVVSATSNIPLEGDGSVERTTSGTAGNSGPAQKAWVDAAIAITPATATNPLNTEHTLTITVTSAGGNLTAGTATASITSGPGSFVGGINTCNYAGGATTASCTVKITSATPGTTVISATSDIVVSGVTPPLKRTTDGDTTVSGLHNSDSARKVWVDAAIAITPATATNPLNTEHTLTITVTSAGGNLTAGTATASITSGPGSFVGGINTCNYAGGATTASCTVKITSATPGTTVISATSDIVVSGVNPPLKRTTDGTVTVSGLVNSDPAQKNWGNPPPIEITKTADAPSVAAGSPIGFTITVTNPVGNSTAAGVAITDALPGGSGINWSIESQTPSGACSISGLPPNQTLNCAPRDLAGGSSITVHVTSPTTTASCGQYDNTAAFTSTNNGSGEASASTTVVCQPVCPAGLFQFRMLANGDLAIVYDQFPAPNDNSYGVNAVGWPSGHTFSNLTGSDKAGFQLKDPNGVVRLSINLDYLHATTPSAAAPSGYASLGPFGGDGDVVVGTLTPNDIRWDTSLARNLNLTGYFSLVAGKPTQSAATLPPNLNGANLVVNSPPTLNTVDSYVLKSPNPWNGTYANPEYSGAHPQAQINGWNFHDTYFATITAAKLASLGFDIGTWKVEPNLTVLHNSPAKPCPPSPPSADTLAVTKWEVKDNQVKITITNSASSDAFLTALRFTWPQGSNGNLREIKLDGDSLWKGDLTGGTTDPLGNPVGSPPLVADQSKRKIDKNSSDVLTFVFAVKPVAPLTNGAYGGSAFFGTLEVGLGLPRP